MTSTVYVLGAGFTKAFFPDAPLVYDNYPIREVAAEFANLPAVTSALGAEIASSVDGRFNLERIMTRLTNVMPYESDGSEASALRIALEKVEGVFTERLQKATAEVGPNHDTFVALATKCISEGIDVVTFNYDDAWDSALWNVHRVTGRYHPERYWHPDGGYGFFCHPSRVCVQDALAKQDIATNLLIKLHGSLNWRIRRGARIPYGFDDIVHRADWFPTFEGENPKLENEVERQLLPGPLLIPPVLDKTRVSAEPILQTTWRLARERLAGADSVTFLGYSFPPTDLAARFLFSEGIALSKRGAIRIVDLQPDEGKRARLVGAYEGVFGRLDSGQFSWDGAVAWAERTLRAS